MLFTRIRATLLLALSTFLFVAWPKLFIFIVSQGFAVHFLFWEVQPSTLTFIAVLSNSLSVSIVLAGIIFEELERRNRRKFPHKWIYGNIGIIMAYGWLLFFYASTIFGPCYCSFDKMNI